ncbi:MAG: DUF308 domain-containing protein [Methanobrevibacter sp.]|nr:DUF308 domain-containing protein [Methanobrevibacter sp.]
MNNNQILGILSTILGLIFIVAPVFSTALASTLLGISFLLLGIFSILTGIFGGTGMGGLLIISGILAAILGFILTTNIFAIPIIIAFQFYIIGFLMILMGIAGLFAGDQISKILSILMIILAIVMIALGVLTIDNPIIAPILMGASLIVEGVNLFVIKV